MSQRNIGVWLIGALGSISTTVMMGALALRQGLISPAGMITCTEPFSKLDLAPVEAMEFGGCDVRTLSLQEVARQFAQETGSIDAAILNAVEADLGLIDQHICLGTSMNCGEAIGRLAGDADCCNTPAREEIERFVGYLNKFKAAK
jgi:myo-inositol-1-phosphate synthase